MHFICIYYLVFQDQSDDDIVEYILGVSAEEFATKK